MAEGSITDYGQALVKSLAYAIQRGESSLQNVPGLLRKVISESMWQQREIGGGQIVTLKEFRQFVTAEYPEGLGTTLETLKSLCAGEDDLTDYLERARVDGIPALNPIGANRHTSSPDNIRAKTYGTDPEYTLARLKRDYPELADKVINGELSANAAAIEAGFRKERIGVPNHDMRLAARALKAKLTQDQIVELIAHLLDDQG